MGTLAAEGGYQDFALHGGEWLILGFSGITAVLAIATGFILRKGVLDNDQGTPKMVEIASAIQEGALAYLKRQFRTIVIILVPLALIVFFTSTEIAKPDGSIARLFGLIHDGTWVHVGTPAELAAAERFMATLPSGGQLQ